MEGEVSAEFQDWEVLVNSDSEAVNSPNCVHNSRNLGDVEADSDGGVLRLDYFSLENDNRYAKTVAVDASDEGSVESDNPSWIDPVPETRFHQNTIPGEFWSDSCSDRSDERKVSDFDLKNELGLRDNVILEGEFAETCEVGDKEGKGGNFECSKGGFDDFKGKNEMDIKGNAKSEAGFGDFGGKYAVDNDLDKFWSNSCGDSLVFDDVTKVNEDSKILGESESERGSREEDLSIVAAREKKPEGNEGKRRVVWWKVPFELLRYCVFKISPVWTFSMAAAVMGFLILGRRLYKMKRKTRSMPLNVTVDDKKVSQFMSRAARLNEAFSVVRRVPIVRPLLPAAGVNSWPVMTLR